MAPRPAVSRKAGKQASTKKHNTKGRKRVRANSSATLHNGSTIPQQKDTREKRQRKSQELEQFKHFRLRPTVYSKWIPMSRKSEKFVTKMLERNVVHVLSKTSDVNKDTARGTLDDLQATLLSSLRGLNVPPKSAMTSHETLHINRVRLEKKLNLNTDQIRRLDEALEEEEEVLDLMEQEKTQLEQEPLTNTNTSTPNKHKVHPALSMSSLEVVTVSEDYGQLATLISAASRHPSSTINSASSRHLHAALI